MEKRRIYGPVLALGLLSGAACGEGQWFGPKKTDAPPAAASPATAPSTAPTTAPATAAARVDDKELQRIADEAHKKRLAELDPVFRDSSISKWLQTAGFRFSDLSGPKVEARQIEEETLVVDGNRRILASGVQVDVKDLDAQWPNALTTSDPSVKGKARVCIQPDTKNPSLLCTDVKGFTGKATLYVDVQNWGELAPKK